MWTAHQNYDGRERDCFLLQQYNQLSKEKEKVNERTYTCCSVGIVEEHTTQEAWKEEWVSEREETDINVHAAMCTHTVSNKKEKEESS